MAKISIVDEISNKLQEFNDFLESAVLDKVSRDIVWNTGVYENGLWWRLNHLTVKEINNVHVKTKKSFYNRI